MSDDCATIVNGATGPLQERLRALGYGLSTRELSYVAARFVPGAPGMTHGLVLDLMMAADDKALVGAVVLALNQLYRTGERPIEAGGMVATPTAPRTFNIVQTGSSRNLDPIDVAIYDESPGRGRIVISCFGWAWAIGFGAMGGRTMAQFFCDCDSDYLVDKLSNAQRHTTKGEDRYLERVVLAVQVALLGGGGGS